MGRFGIPQTNLGWIGFITGIAGSVLYATQNIWNWFGITDGDKAVFSLIIILLMSMAIGFSYTANKIIRTSRKAYSKNYAPLWSAIKITAVLFCGVLTIQQLLNMLVVKFETYASLRMLAAVTSADVASLEQFALGIRQIVRAMFLIVPGFIATWGGLSVMTADSISDAEGGPMAVVAALIVLFVVWIFKAIDVNIMFMGMVRDFGQMAATQIPRSLRKLPTNFPKPVAIAA